MKITSALLLSAVLLPTLAGCTTRTISAATETDRAWCESLRAVMPDRSRSDTKRTQARIGALYDFYEDACGEYRGYERIG